MTRIVPFFLVFMLPVTLALGVELGGLWTIVPLLITFGMIPLLDALLDENQVNPDEAVGHRRMFDVPLLAWVPVQLATTVYVLWRLSSGDFSVLEIVGSVASLGVLNGAGGINIAHELMHRKHPLHRAAAEILMTCVSYTHFCVEHVLGHHRHVATPEDAASSRLGEGIYRFYPRTVLCSLRSAWGLERGRCAQRDIAWWSLRDRRTRYALVLAAVYLGIYLSMGPLALGLFIAHGVIAFSLLEAINYVEHYGLERKRLASGKYERVRPEHSWNSAHRVSNYYLFNLARHSDHHYLASREYDRLRHHAAAPQLPSGYASMVILALCPPLWFRVMNPRVEAWNARAGQAASDSAPVRAPVGAIASEAA
ncbi:alkane 1-monooxygenase [Enhygromyxa salina]|uniref:Alkane 1-monooxygenase 2 n=1 Tax=Enhygromyxa salina TaxID=215803 RepID=A0A2S9YVL1_9BACT|nr:alkane 1-monooxygenase [Enhygromyxa salina]PRQ09138.1 Alkane 1-monooxygenase 2 [Enhygromyxa salina]